MGVNRGAFRSRWGRAGLAGVLVGVLGLGLTGQASAFVGSALVPGFTPSPGGGPGGSFVPTGEAKFWNSVAKTVAVVDAAGKSMRTEVAMTAAANAGRQIAVACLSNPVVCAGGAAAAWFIASRIRQQDGHYVVDEDGYGACYQVQTPGTSTYTGTCFSTIASAASSWTNTANAIGYLDAQLPYGGSREVSFTIATVPASIGVNSGGTATADRTTVTTTCDSSGACTTDTKHDTASFTIRRFPDQSTIITRPATEPDMIDHGNRYPPGDDVLNEAGAVPVGSPKFRPWAEPLTDAYPSNPAQPQTSQWLRDWLQGKGLEGTDNPLDFEVTPVTTPGDNPNTPEDESEDPATGDDPDVDEPPTELDIPQLCEEFPNISACAEIGEAPTDEVPKSTFNMVFQAEPLGLPAGCPAAIPVLGYTLSFDTACTIANWMAPLVTALGAMCAAMICVAAIRGS